MAFENWIGQPSKSANATKNACKNQFLLGFDDINLSRNEVEANAASGRRNLRGVSRNAEADAKPAFKALEIDSTAGTRLQNSDRLAEREIRRAQHGIEVVRENRVARVCVGENRLAQIIGALIALRIVAHDDARISVSRRHPRVG